MPGINGQSNEQCTREVKESKGRVERVETRVRGDL